MRDDLKQKAQQLAKEQGVSLNGFINATLAATIAQQETLALFSDRLKEVDQDTLHKRVLKFMRKTWRGKEPSVEEVERAVRG
jgi:esterase/lipase